MVLYVRCQSFLDCFQAELQLSQLPPGNQTWQWTIPSLWMIFRWRPLSFGGCSIPCGIFHCETWTAPTASTPARAGEEDLALWGRFHFGRGPRGRGCGAPAGPAGVAGWVLHRGQGARGGAEPWSGWGMGAQGGGSGCLGVLFVRWAGEYVVFQNRELWSELVGIDSRWWWSALVYTVCGASCGLNIHHSWQEWTPFLGIPIYGNPHIGQTWASSKN